MGILPGAPVRLIQSFPSFVFQVHQTQFAVDKDIADAIYIRLVEGDTMSETNEELPGHGQGRGRFAQRFGRWWSRRGRPD